MIQSNLTTGTCRDFAIFTGFGSGAMLCCSKPKELFSCNVELLNGAHVNYSKNEHVKVSCFNPLKLIAFYMNYCSDAAVEFWIMHVLMI